MGEEFISAGLKKRNGVLYVKPKLKPEFWLINELGRFVEVEIELYGIKIMILEIYTSNDDKAIFYVTYGEINFLMKIGVWWESGMRSFPHC